MDFTIKVLAPGTGGLHIHCVVHVEYVIIILSTAFSHSTTKPVPATDDPLPDLSYSR